MVFLTLKWTNGSRKQFDFSPFLAYLIAMNNKKLADWLAARLNRCLPMDNWHRESLEKLLRELRENP